MWNKVCIFSCLIKYIKVKFLFFLSLVEINKIDFKLRNICNFVYFFKYIVRRMNFEVRLNLV